MKKMLFLFFLAITSFCPGCKKDEAKDPCAGFAWLTAPTVVKLTFIDKTTGENILLAKNIDASKITITPQTDISGISTGKGYKDGVLAFHIEDYLKGEFKYSIKIDGVGTSTLAYTNEEKLLDNPCHPSTIIVHEPAITEYAYTTTRDGTWFIITVKI
ncbi:hypothetical protein [Chitinophaga sancti]|uniref:Uncharacterized protein n=1 Tax=Chitinophaga sancti TaxID=1004 RepID=A0A1K1QNP9_9BACT|nr:hypothetical protein [Chitinophaga sancti]WQD65080.1 hypothetical protein U0033_11810 [Chitinophaga sancti]WQG89296.1 hypothetical protein SR876_30660 [Chitinophaga sancti]SFW61324.1 hypothetical protein SAMN05661012_02955 [Chitinophaga sancti]